MVTNAKIARALGVTKMCVTLWRERGCPNSSVRAAKAWARVFARNYRRREERADIERLEGSVYRFFPASRAE
jgi:phage terminase Nu1 subunit (DNA packaging protein)